MAAQRSHVPKFGNWDGDNVPYTVYFENARKEKAGGVRINPNDPEQNPDAFSAAACLHLRHMFNQYRSAATEPSSDRSPSGSSASSVINPNHHRKKSPSPSGRLASVPKFGAWDENDPRSAEGFTVIFDKVKEDKQIASSKLPTVSAKTGNGYDLNNRNQEAGSRRCCCLF